MFERLLLTVIVIGVFVGAFALLQMVQRRRLSRVASADGVAKVLYFRADSCAGCSTQKRYLEQLDATVETIDVEREPDKAAQFNVMTLPSTIVVDAVGRVKAINYGITNAQRLSEQLALTAS